MKRTMRLLAILFAFVLVAAACGDDDSTTQPEVDQPSVEGEPSAEGDGDDDSTTQPEVDQPSVEGEGKIAVLLPDSATSARWENDDRRFFEEAFAAAGLSSDQYLILNAEGDASTMQTQAEQAITDGATVLLMVNLDSGSGAAIIDNARSQGVNVIDYDRLTVEGPGADYYVSFDNVAVGATMGAAMEAALAGFAGVPNVMILDGGPTDNNATLFAQGYMSFAQPNFDDGSWNLVARQAVPDWDNVQAQTIAEQILTAAGNDVDAAIVANDGMAGGVIAALQAQGINGIPVTGQDATVGGIQNILVGDQLMTVYKAVKAEASAAADLAIALWKGQEPTNVTAAVNNGTNDIPSVLLTPVATDITNINETVIADGFRSVAEICVGDVADACAAAGITGAAAPSGSASAGEGKIAVLLPDSATSARWENDDRRFFEEAFAAAGLSSDQYLILNAEGDASTMQTQAEQAITDGATVLLMVNLDSGSGAAIIDNARSQGVNVIDYDRLTVEGPGADYYVSFDNVAVGATMGAAMEAALAGFAGVPNVMILDGGPTDNNATLFAQGYMSFAQPNFDDGSWNLVARQAVPDWDNVQAQTIAEQILTAAGNDVDAAIVANDGMAGGVIAALQAQGINGIPVTGQDATVGGIQNILVGDQLMTVYKAVKAEASAAADLAIALWKGQEPTNVTAAVNNGTNDIPSVLLTPVATDITNINETVIADGFRSVAEICVGNIDDTEFCVAAN